MFFSKTSISGFLAIEVCGGTAVAVNQLISSKAAKNRRLFNLFDNDFINRHCWSLVDKSGLCRLVVVKFKCVTDYALSV